MKLCVFAIATTVSSLASTSLVAQSPVRTLTIDGAVNEAVQRNLGLLAERVNLSIAEAALITARLRPNPVLSGGADSLDWLGTGFDEINGAGPPQYSVRIDVPFERAHKRELRTEVADQVKRVAEAQFTEAIRRLKLDVALASVDVLERGEQQYLIRGIGMLRSSDDIGDIVVAEHAGTPLLIRDIADVKVGAVPRQGIVGQDGDDEIVSGIVLMRKGENPSEVLAAVKDRVAALNGSILPKPVRIAPFYDRTKLIETTLHTVFKNLLEGALLVTVVLYLFLGNLRAAGIVAVIIPLSLLATFIGLRLRGIPANLLSLGAMDFGIIVDGAVIVLENVFRHLTERQEHHRVPKAVILDAAVEVGRPTVFSMLVIIIAHLPIFTLQRHEGRIFAPMGYTVVSALAGSLLFSLTLVPLLSLFFLGHTTAHEDNQLVRACKRAYQPVLRFALERRMVVLGAAVIALAGSLALVPKLGTEFLPELNEDALWINIMLPPGISVSETSRQLARIRSTLRQFPEVVSVLSKAGRPEDGTDPKMINMAEFLVDVKPEEDWPRGLTKDRLIDQMSTALQTIPGIEPSFSQPIRDNVLESISQIDGQIVVKVFGEDVEVLRRLANDVLHTIAPVRGVARAFVDRAGQVPQLQIEIDRARAARYGLNVADVEDVIETALGGKTATELWEGERRFNVVVRLSEEERQDEAAIANVLVDTPGGLRIPLSDVATVSVGSGSMNIARESGMRVAAIAVLSRGVRRVVGAAAHSADDNVVGHARTHADGPLSQHRLGSTTAARGGHHRRVVLRRGADARRPACAVCDVRGAASSRRGGDNVRSLAW